jgi:N-acetylglutamate synthase-like GNAT family acetyltransferase
MNDLPQEWRREGLVVSTDRAKVDLDAMLALMHTVRWAASMTRDVLARAVEESIVFSVYDDAALIGLTRVVTDRATYAYLTDVIVAEHRRGAGVGRWMVGCVLEHRDLQTLRRIALLTAEAPWLYEKFGFTQGSGRSAYMEIRGALKRG